MRGSEACGRAFEDFAHGIELNDLLLAELRNHETAARAEHQKPALLQALQCLTDRRAADPEIARDVLLAHAFAAGDTAVGNGVPQALIDEIRARARAQPDGIEKFKSGGVGSYPPSLPALVVRVAFLI